MSAMLDDNTAAERKHNSGDAPTTQQLQDAEDRAVISLLHPKRKGDVVTSEALTETDLVPFIRACLIEEATMGSFGDYYEVGEKVMKRCREYLVGCATTQGLVDQCLADLAMARSEREDW